MAIAIFALTLLGYFALVVTPLLWSSSMKQADLVLADGATPAVNHTYRADGVVGREAFWVDDTTKTRVSEWSTIKVTQRPAASNNDGHKVVTSFILPHPLADQQGCCVNKDAPPYSRFTIETLRSRFATNAQADDLVAFIRSYVASPQFAAAVKGQAISS